MNVDRTSPILIGGLVGGLLAGIPIVNCLNCFCCSLYILAGGIAGSLYARNAATLNVFPTAGQGALTGLMAGGLAGIIGSLIGGVINFALSAVGVVSSDPGEIMDQLRSAEIDPEVAEAIGSFLETFGGPPSLYTLTVGLVFGVFFGALFGTVGGMIGCAISRKPPLEPPAAAAPPPVQPPPITGPPGPAPTA